MAGSGRDKIEKIFKALAGNALLWQEKGLAITSPVDGKIVAKITADTKKNLDEKSQRLRAAQKVWSSLPRAARAQQIEALSAAIKQQREALAELIMCEAGKSDKESLTEADGSADILTKTIKDATLPELLGMLRCKERPPVGVVGLITSFNFPLVVANWTLAPALLAGNAVLWKPSEKTPLVALAFKAVFDKAMGAHADLLQILVGGRDIGEALVAHEQVDMISATGSVAMGKGIKATLAKKKNNAIKPILELGGNNGVIISDKLSPGHLEWSVAALMNSFLGTSGQRCTNTRRLIVHNKVQERVVALLTQHISTFLAAGVIGKSNDFGYGALIDADAFARFEKAKKQIAADGGKMIFGNRVLAKEFPDAYYIEPALAVLPKQTAIMHEEVFAPLLFIAPYENFDEALTMLNAPANAGLVGGIYTQNQAEADRFGAANKAGHSLINSPKGTGTPAFGMGFGGNGDSGEGEILNPADPLRPFTRDTHFTRIAQNKDITMSE